MLQAVELVGAELWWAGAQCGVANEERVLPVLVGEVSAACGFGEALRVCAVGVSELMVEQLKIMCRVRSRSEMSVGADWRMWVARCS